MNQKAIGCVARDAWYASRDGRTWQESWEAVATAVAEHIKDEVVSYVMRELDERKLLLTPDRARVIDAARVALPTLKDCIVQTAGGSDVDLEALVRSIESLDALEE